jgi:hypothetical protein
MSLLEFARLLGSTRVSFGMTASNVPGGTELKIDLGGPGGKQSLACTLRNGDRHQGQLLDELILHAIESIHHAASASTAVVGQRSRPK